MSSGCIDVVVGDAECVAVTDCSPYRKEIHTRPFLVAHCIIALRVSHKYLINLYIILK